MEELLDLDKQLFLTFSKDLFSKFQVIENKRFDLKKLDSLKNIDLLTAKSNLDEAYFLLCLDKRKIRQNSKKEITKNSKCKTDNEKLFVNLLELLNDIDILDGSDLSEKIIKSTYLKLKEGVGESNKSVVGVSSRFSKAMESLLAPYPTETSSLLASLLKQLKISSRHKENNMLLTSIVFVGCFLAISPFEFYNVSMSLLLLDCLLYKFGYDFMSYRSLSRFIYKDKKEFNRIYKQLKNSYKQNKLNVSEFVLFILSTLGDIYSSLSYSYSLILEKNKSQDKIYTLIKESKSPVSKEDIEETLFIYSKTTIEKSLGELCSQNKIRLINFGRYSTYVLSSSSSSIFIF